MATDWDACYRGGQTPWDKGGAAPPLLEWLESTQHHFDGDVLVPGCGFGHDVRAIAATGQAKQVHGLDVSAAALIGARRHPPVTDEQYFEADLFALPSEFRGRYDWVFEHTCFCAIDPSRRVEYVEAIAGALRSGGQLLAIFYLRPWSGGETPPQGGGPPFGTSAGELDALFAARFDLLDEWLPTRAFPGREGREIVRLLTARQEYAES